MFKIHNAKTEVQAIADGFVPKRLQQRFYTGIEGFGLTSFASLNANGRLLARNRHTGESRVSLIVGDKRFPRLLLRTILKR